MGGMIVRGVRTKAGLSAKSMRKIELLQMDIPGAPLLRRMKGSHICSYIGRRHHE
jgi:hypothetical protein